VEIGDSREKAASEDTRNYWTKKTRPRWFGAQLDRFFVFSASLSSVDFARLRAICSFVLFYWDWTVSVLYPMLIV
jgi:hypothetical protein